MYGRFFGLLALGNTNDGGQTRANENGALGAISFVVQMCTGTGYLVDTRQKRYICVSTLFGTLCDLISYDRFSTVW